MTSADKSLKSNTFGDMSKGPYIPHLTKKEYLKENAIQTPRHRCHPYCITSPTTTVSKKVYIRPP